MRNPFYVDDSIPVVKHANDQGVSMPSFESFLSPEISGFVEWFANYFVVLV